MMRYQTICFASVITLCIATTSSATFAQVTGNSAPPPNQQALQVELDKSFQSSAAMRVFRDPKTGEFRHSNAPMVPLGNTNTANAKQSAPAAVKLHSNGMKSATLGESNMRYATVHRHADGTLHTDCVGGHSLSSTLAEPTPQVKGEKHVR